MGLFEHWPYVNFHDLNLDWIIGKIKNVETSEANSQASAEASAESAAASQLSADAAMASQEAAHQSELNSAQSEENAADSEASAKNYADHIADPVAGLVTDWLEDNITPTTPAVDASLTVSGAAADAKVTGDKINLINGEIDARDKTLYKSVHYDKTVLTNSGYITLTGVIGINDNFGYSDPIKVPYGAKSITINRHGPFTEAAVSFYTDQFLGIDYFISGVASPDSAELYGDPIDINIPSNAKYFAFSNRIDTAEAYDFDAQINFDQFVISERVSTIPVLGTDTEIKNTDFVTSGQFITPTGTLQPNNQFGVSVMYELTEKTKEIVLHSSGKVPTGCAVAFYYWPEFTALSFISGTAIPEAFSNDNMQIPVPNGALYVAFSGRTAVNFDATIKAKDIADTIEYKPYSGKYLSILGDSISSYQGYIPEGNAYYYPQPYMADVDSSWWKRLLDTTGMTLLVNNSWSGATMSGTTAGAGLNRAENLDDGVNTPDHIIVFMGVNDFKYPRELGECGLNAETYSPMNFSDAYYTALNRIRTKYPNARLYLGTIMEFNYPNDNVTGFPIINSNNVNLIEFNDAIRKLADLYGADVIEFTKCGVTYFNKSSTLGDTAGLHPNAKGHYLMFREAMKHFE